MGKLVNAGCFLLLFALGFIGCGKDDPPPAPPPKVDTLSAGWSKLTTPARVMDLFFVDNNTGFVGGSTFSKTTDGGQTWTGVNLPVENPGIINIYFTDATFGWLLGKSPQGMETLFRTTDGGTSFTNTFTNSNGLSDVQFLDKKRGFLVGYNHFYSSIDSGKTWATFNNKFIEGGLTLFFFDELNGIVVSNRHIYRTIDGGKNFDIVQNLPSANIYSLPFGIHFLDKNIGWVPCLDGLYKTTDGGKTWIFASIPGEGKDVHFFDQQEGYLLQTKAVLKTTDGGNTFTKVLSAPNSQLYELQFTDKKHGWVIANQGPIYRFLEP